MSQLTKILDSIAVRTEPCRIWLETHLFNNYFLVRWLCAILVLSFIS